ncbi:MAG TPA: hypothetical protein VG518_05110, partial [Solirubrobacterales bacterium]|nr:hypothetical protein [Solirubrobacterales bacterium]
MRLRAGTTLSVAVALLAFAAAPATAASWSVTKLLDDQVIGPMFAASCPSTSFCVVGGSDRLIATSNSPAGGAQAWDVFHPGGPQELENMPPKGSVVYPGSQVRGLSCPEVGLCVGVTLDGKVLSSTNPGGGAGAWALRPLSEGGPNIHMT